MNKTVTLAECAERLRSADDILILTHGRPDGDTIGSGAALCALGTVCSLISDLLD